MATSPGRDAERLAEEEEEPPEAPVLDGLLPPEEVPEGEEEAVMLEPVAYISPTTSENPKCSEMYMDRQGTHQDRRSAHADAHNARSRDDRAVPNSARFHALAAGRGGVRRGRGACALVVGGGAVHTHGLTAIREAVLKGPGLVVPGHVPLAALQVVDMLAPFRGFRAGLAGAEAEFVGSHEVLGKGI